MFSQTAQYYDTIYLAMKDYGAEADKLTSFIYQYCRAVGVSLRETRRTTPVCTEERAYRDHAFYPHRV
jgi:hypothetical protein